MNKLPTRKEKITLLKEVAKGNHKTLNALREEQNQENVSWETILLCFYYLLEHGRPDGCYGNSLKFDECWITSMEDLKDLEDSISIFRQTNSFETISYEALKKIAECWECYRILKESNQLKLLEPYKH